jgi:hypothetical protein
MSINKIVQDIIQQYSGKYSKGYITYDLYSQLSTEDFKIVEEAFNLKKEMLEYIECFECDEELQVRRKGNIRFIHCFASDCGAYKELKNNEDVARTINLHGIANLLIKVLGITENKENIINGKLIYLGQKQIVSPYFNIYLLKEVIDNETLIQHCKPKSKKNPSIIIKLTSQNLEINQANITDCQFDDLVFYDESLKRFSFNKSIIYNMIEGSFTGAEKSTIQKSLNEDCLLWFKNLISKKAIKRGEKAKLKQEAKDLFNVSGKSFDKIWEENAPIELKQKGRIKS